MLGEVLTAIVTPFHQDGSVNLDAFRRLCAHLVENGSDGLVVAGTTGESPTLSDDEKLTLFATAVETVGDRATVIAGTGSNDTAHSVHLTREAAAVGVDGLLVVVPYYNKPPARGVVAHFAAIAEASELPIIAYNIPQRVVINVEPETFAELRRIPTVTAVKQAWTDMEHARAIVAQGFDLYAGNDDLILPFLEVGGVGGVCVFTHLVGTQVKRMIGLAKSGELDAARALEEEILPVRAAVNEVTTNPIPIKTALAMLGHEVGGLRLPLVEATDAERARVREGLERAGLLVGAAA